MIIDWNTLDAMVRAYWTSDGSDWAACDEEAQEAIRWALLAALRTAGITLQDGPIRAVVP